MQKNCRHCTISKAKANQKKKKIKITQSTIKFQLMQMKCSSNKNLGHQANKWWQKRIFQPLSYFFFSIFCFSISFASDVLTQKWLDVRLKFSIFQCSTWYFCGNTLSIFIFPVFFLLLFSSFLPFSFHSQIWWNFSFYIHYLTQLFLYYYDLNVLFCFILYFFYIWIEGMKSDENDE